MEGNIRAASRGVPPVAQPRAASREQPPVRWREILAVVLIIVVSDVSIYRSFGFAGYAAFFVGIPLLLWLGAPRARGSVACWLVGMMLLLLAIKTLWCGGWLLVACGFALVAAFAMAIAGLCPHVMETIVFASQTFLAGYEGLHAYRRAGHGYRPTMLRVGWLSLLLPLVAFVAFGLLFIVANPDLFVFFGETMERVFNTLREWILRVAPSWQEVVFWLVVLFVAVGLLRPVLTRTLSAETPLDAEVVSAEAPSPVAALLYAPFRNTLLTVIALFAVYLVFEFKTLWFRVFPEGFHYSGYAHEGAAWLTVALALASVVLSLIFRGQILRDPRLGRLRRLAWIWSLENLLLAVAVYHRLWIYVGFNGMTRMRMVGIFGTSCVVAGLLIVVWKIVRQRDFVWLVRRHLWALAITIYLFALTPVDALVTRYNVQRVLAGDPAPSVEISVHPINSEGVLFLIPLVESDNEIIREGIQAMLAERLEEAEAKARKRAKQGWTTFQIADRLVLERLRADKDGWAEYTDRANRQAALKRFHEYAYQWY
jgi:hypothetical protein